MGFSKKDSLIIRGRQKNTDKTGLFDSWAITATRLTLPNTHSIPFGSSRAATR